LFFFSFFILKKKKLIQQERQMRHRAKNSREKLLHECSILRNQLQECNINFLTDEGDNFVADSSSLSDALDLLATSDDRIGLLLAEVPFIFSQESFLLSHSIFHVFLIFNVCPESIFCIGKSGFFLLFLFAWGGGGGGYPFHL
jgi:hypothetical protein